MPVETPLTALTRRGFLLSTWPWRSALYLLGTAVVAFLPAGVLGMWAVAIVQSTRDGMYGRATTVLLVGLFLLVACGPWFAGPIARLERLRLRVVDCRPLAGVLLRRYGSAAVWREVAYAVLLFVVGPLLVAAAGGLLFMACLLMIGPFLTYDQPVTLLFDTVSTPAESVPYAVAGVLLLPVFAYLAALLAGGHASVARALLGTEMTQVSARLVDAFEAERRRIEQDLHDGAQERLVSLTLRLGMARLDTPEGTQAHADVTAAHDQAKQLMTELRDLVRGIHPRVLTDHGLKAALEELADRSPIPIDVHAPTGRLPAALESTAYFIVKEAITNATKHANPTAITVVAQTHATHLVLEITDNGTGGATTMTALTDRVTAAGGTMRLSSPIGGPTTIRAELPCQP